MVSVSFTAHLLLFCSNLLFPSRNLFRLIFQLNKSWSFWACCCRDYALGSQADWCRVYGFELFFHIYSGYCLFMHSVSHYKSFLQCLKLFNIFIYFTIQNKSSFQKTSCLSSSLYHSLAFSTTFLKTKFCNYFICRNS